MHIPLQSVLNALALQEGWSSFRPIPTHESLNMGTLTPYRRGPDVPGIQSKLPDDCAVEQVMLVSFYILVLHSPDSQ